jgi:hypothetical protein
MGFPLVVHLPQLRFAHAIVPAKSLRKGTTMLKTFKVSLNIKQEINADDEEEALGIFWDDFHIAQSEEELADIKEL